MNDNLNDSNIRNTHLMLSEKIKQFILKNGDIDFATFMNFALYDSEYGYYTSCLPKLGKTGDFTTAPLISPLYSYCIAKVCYQVLSSVENGNVFEFGAGTGQMAYDILYRLNELNSLPEKYYILEPSPYLKFKQQELLQNLPSDIFSKITWLNTLPNKTINGIVLANEVLDAMPVNRIKLIENKMFEFFVTLKDKSNLSKNINFDNDVFEYKLNEITNPRLLKYLENLKNSNEIEFNSLFKNESYQYTFEINLNIFPWIKSVSDLIANGVLLVIDYGYCLKEFLHPNRYMGTLMCHHKHKSNHSPLTNIGLQDITAHINFDDVYDAAMANDFSFQGFSNQANFLLSLGLLEEINNFKNSKISLNRNSSLINNNSLIDNHSLNSKVNILTAPHEMGEIFKIMAFDKNFNQQLIGFDL